MRGGGVKMKKKAHYFGNPLNQGPPYHVYQKTHPFI